MYGGPRNVLDVPEDQPALAIFNVFTAHYYNNVVEKLQSDWYRSLCQPAALANYSQWMFVSMTDFNLMKNSFTYKVCCHKASCY